MRPLELQRTLKALGFDPGPIDGIPGRRTQQAVRAFQAANRLVVDGIVGPATITALRARTIDPKAPAPEAIAQAVASGAEPYPATPWLDEALRYMGLLEGRGAANNPVLMRMAQALPKSVRGYFLKNGDATPWCGMFIHNALAVTLPNEPMPANPLGALQWKPPTWGVALPGPTLGAIATKSRPGAPGSGHVFIVTGGDAHRIEGVGGNQSDSVTRASWPRDEIKSYSWPRTVPLPKRLKLPARGGAAASGSEA